MAEGDARQPRARPGASPELAAVTSVLASLLHDTYEWSDEASSEQLAGRVRAWIHLQLNEARRAEADAREDTTGPARPPRTRAEALAQAHRWGHTLSHNDIMLTTEADPAHRPQTLVAITQADAAEVHRLAALWTMLPERLEEL